MSDLIVTNKRAAPIGLGGPLLTDMPVELNADGKPKYLVEPGRWADTLCLHPDVPTRVPAHYVKVHAVSLAEMVSRGEIEVHEPEPVPAASEPDESEPAPEVEAS